MMYQKSMGRKERVTQVKLISGRKRQAAHVDGQEIGAVAASNRDSFEQTGAGNAHLKHPKEKKKKPLQRPKKKKMGQGKKKRRENDTARTVSQKLQWT